MTVDASYPPDPKACEANQPKDLHAAYPGTLEVGRQPDGHLYLITELTFPQYLKGIAEMPTTWPLPALEAQAVAARTYAISHMNAGGAQARALNYNLCSTDACQVYRGLQVTDAPSGQAWAQAVDDTTGQILEYQGRPIDAFYFSTSNGHTYSSSDIFGGPSVPYLQPVVENDDTTSPTSSWSVTIPLTDLADMLRLAGSWGTEPIDTVDQQGDQITVSGGDKTATFSVSSFRNKLDVQGTCLTPKRYPTGNLPQVVPSVWMTLSQQGDSVVMTGRGWGHGVGMVQWGAKGKADRGLSYRQILAYYYGGLEPVRVGEPGSIRVLLATGVQSLTVTPSGQVRVDGASGLSGGVTGTVTISGGSAMTITPALPAPAAPPTLTLTSVTVTATAMPGKPAGFSFTLNHPANVGITYQESGVTATGQVPQVALGGGDQTLTWDPLAAGLAPGTYDAALVADDGVSRVVSPSFAIDVSIPPPPPPSSTVAVRPVRKAEASLPPWVLVAGGVALVVILVAAGGYAAVTIRRRP